MCDNGSGDSVKTKSPCGKGRLTNDIRATRNPTDIELVLAAPSNDLRQPNVVNIGSGTL